MTNPLTRVRRFAIDMDGTIYRGGSLFPVKPLDAARQPPDFNLAGGELGERLGGSRA